MTARPAPRRPIELSRAGPPSNRRGFTLVELLIVVVILGVLAATVIAMVTNANRDARRAGTEATVRETQQAIELYRSYTGRLPDLISSWSAVTDRTTSGGVTVGPFLNRPPRNLVAVHTSNPSCITDGNAPVLYTSTCTFQYDYAGGAGSGRFIAAYEPGP